MCFKSFLALFALFMNTLALPTELFESEEVIPTRINNRRSGRFWKRSEDLSTFKISAFGKDFFLNLIHDDHFLSPDFMIHRVTKKRFPDGADTESRISRKSNLGVIETEETVSDLRRCFYSGTVDSNVDSVVAVSLCGGISGSFVSDGDEYLIAPKNTTHGGSEAPYDMPHMIRRRVAGSHQTGQSVMPDNTELSTANKNIDSKSTLRNKRFVSEPRFVETLLVADSSMTNFHGDDIKHYILTLISVTAQLYKHPSIKNSVHLVVVKVLIVEDEEVGPSISSNGDLALRNFCTWQQHFNTQSDRHSEHYDTALLFTRQDICGKRSCDTLGVADVGTMCDPERSCSVVEDDGLQASFTAAHELGHVLSMPHDDSKTCERLFGNLGRHHMMAPLFIHLNKTQPWSPCSAMYITEFFDNGHGDCLLDAPAKSMPLPTTLPGLEYDLEQQCQQTFGEDFQHCPNTSDADVCSQLWCREEGQLLCTTKNGSLPWADGTACGNERICFNKECVEKEELLKPKVLVDGQWAAWSPWGDCSRTCGGGVQFSYRDCNDPEPQNGGKYCEGQRVKYQSCNIQDCPSNHGKSFREEQCEKYNSFNYVDMIGNVKQWIPKYAGVSPRDRCKLFCRARGSSEFKVFEAKVIDGTPCGPDTTSICVQGQCIKAGCDRIIGSNMKLDKCGVCGGNGSLCRKITGTLNKVRYGYNDIVTIPIGATNIDLKQRSHRGLKHDGNYLAIKAENGKFLLNGNFSVVTVEQDIPVNGAVLKYSGSSTTLERIQSFGKLQEPIVMQLLAMAGEMSPPKVKYTFFIPKDISFNKPKAKKPSMHVIPPFGVSQWILGEWSECSKSCGSGWLRRNVECRDASGQLSFDCDRALKPEDIKPCGDLPCPLWQMGPWSSCSRTCGEGERRRSVFCIDYTGKTIEPEKCDPTKRPMVVIEACNFQEC
ncbi:A disintegrin and metalloproteinase with thrombospondin motifs 8-like [Polypterus senegalus]|uniref:A disintegrin and metalloproteinase with thrombospondin motifs 8-like n=1 Tax=Polypterus senegalus TaxID=55291 RepID=UPI001964B916|nr:A disintegrin and metalloproteinase with thrombospondin motifs 8-like [Polypterus senegalus]